MAKLVKGQVLGRQIGGPKSLVCELRHLQSCGLFHGEVLEVNHGELVNSGESLFIVVDFLTIIFFSSHWARNVHIKNCNTRFSFKYYIKIFMSDTYQNTLMIRIMHGKYYVIMQKCSFYSINDRVHNKLIPNIKCLSWNNKKYVGAQYPLRIGKSKCDMFFLLPKWLCHMFVCVSPIFVILSHHDRL